MKYYFSILIAIVVMQASANPMSAGYAIVSDPDGHVNVRETASLNGRIVGQLVNDIPLSCSDDMSGDPKFCFDKTEGPDHLNAFIYKDKLLFLDNSPAFQSLPLIKSSKTSATFQNQYAKLESKIRHYQFNQKDFTLGKDRSYPYYLYKGKPFYGTDNNRVSNAYLYSNITLTIGNHSISIPQSEFEQSFITDFFVDAKQAFSSTSVYINPKNNHTYIFATQADGAAIYTVVFEFKNNQYFRKYIWSEAL